MATAVPLPTGSYRDLDPRASGRRLVNCMSEVAPQTSPLDSKQNAPPAILRRMWGISPIVQDGTLNQVRGMWDMRGVTYVVIGPSLYTFVPTVPFPNATLTQILGVIPGTGFVRMTDNTECLVILIPGTTSAFTYTNAGGFQPLIGPSAETFTTLGAIDCWFIDSYIVFLARNGLEFYNDDGQTVSGTGQITFNTGGLFIREFGTDPFVGMAVDHRTVLMFGSRTSEGYIDVGNAQESPFGSAPDSFLQIGMHPAGGYTAALQDQSVFWLANDLTVRRRNGQTPIRVSNSGIEQVLESCKELLGGCYAMNPTIGGHPLWVLNIPLASRCLVYDCLTTEWFELESLANNLGYWRPLCYYNAHGLQLVGDSQGAGIGYLDSAVFDEWGSPMRAAFDTQSIYDKHNRITHRRVEVVVTPGGTPTLTSTVNKNTVLASKQANAGGALITLYASDDSGTTFTARQTKSLGALGQRQWRAFWTNLGQSRDRSYRFQVSDPTPLFTVDIQAELSGGKW